MAFLLIPTGIGTFKLHDWGRKLSLNLRYIWLILGISITSTFIVSLPEFLKNINLSAISFILVFIALIGIIIPFIFIKTYKSERLRNIFKNKNKNFIDEVPQAVLLICSLNIIFILLLHAGALLQYIFPFFGKIILHREGVHYISSAVFILAILTYGFWKRYSWAFWGLIIYYGLMLVSITMTFSKYSLTDIINLLNLPSYEQSHMVPILSVFLDFNLTAILGSFLVIILCLIIYSKKHFQSTPEKNEDSLSFEN